MTSPFDVDIIVKNETDIDLYFEFDTVGRSTTVFVKRHETIPTLQVGGEQPEPVVSLPCRALDQIHQRNKALDARNQKLEALLRKEGIDPDA